MDIWHNLSEQLNIYDDAKKRQDIMLINYGVNVDFLGNFISSESVDFGGFVGIGIGGNSWSGKWLKDFESDWVAEGLNKFNFTSFDFWVNVGLRTNIATYHGLELVARVPFLKTQLIKANDEANGVSFKFDIKQNYNILARYSFSF